MPAYGGYFAPLTDYLPDILPPAPGFHRSNIAVMFLSDLVLDGLEIDWSAHLPLMLHVIFLGLDHTRAMVYEHCKKLLENLLLLASAQEQQSIARLLLEYRCNIADTLKLIAEDREAPGSLEGHSDETVARSTLSMESAQTLIPDVTMVTENLNDPDSFSSVEEIIKAILDFMEPRRGRPLWTCEDITPKTLTTQSSLQLEYFLKCVVRFFKDLSPLALVEQRWSQVALQLALSCSSRHYAGRSFQVLRALHIRPCTQMLSDILSRLVETVAEQGEDMQGYVTEIILTLESAVDNLDIELRPIDFMRELFMSTPNLAKEYSSEGRKGSLMAPRQALPHHARSTSYSVTAGPPHRASPYDVRLRSSTDIDRMRTNIPRSRSAQSLKNMEQGGTEDKMTIVAQMFWIAVSLLESDYEYEFSLAVRLLEKILQHMQPERNECREKLDKILQQIKWNNFPGVQTQLLKGFTSAVTADVTWSLMSRLTVSISSPIIDPTENLGFPINVIALLPYFVQNYESPTQKCKDAADHIVQMCSQKSERLNNLATVMSLYSHGTFGRDSFQWTKCVVKYLLDVYVTASFSMISFLVEVSEIVMLPVKLVLCPSVRSDFLSVGLSIGGDSFQGTKCVIKYLLDVYVSASFSMITFLEEVLEKGPPSYQPPVFQILHCMVHYIDLISPASSAYNSEFFTAITKHVQSSHWKEALKILKLAVRNSATLSEGCPSAISAASSEYSAHMSHTSFAEAEMLLPKKQLPGRTLDFSVDLKDLPIMGRTIVNTDIHGPISDPPSGDSLPSSPTRKGSGDSESCWKRPQLSQVIFSQSSDTLDHQQSVVSSGEETSTADGGSSDVMNEPNMNDITLTIRGFDFLDNELEDSEDSSFFPTLDNRRRSYSPPERDGERRFGSVPDLKLLEKAEKTISPSDSISLKEDRISDNESEDQTEEEDVIPSNLPGGTTIVVQNPILEERLRSSPLSISTHSLHSNASDLDLVEISSSTASPSLSQFHGAFLCLTLQNDEVEDVWKSHIDQIMLESSATLTVKTSQIFPRLYRELRRRLDTMTKEACYYIAKTDSLKHIATHFRQVMAMMFAHMECPYFFVDTEMLTGHKVVEKHKFSLLEMKECFETYCMRKDQAEQSLESIKSSIKQESLGDGGNGTAVCSEDEKLELCNKLYRLIFQLVLLFENYVKLMEIFRSVTSSPQIADMSLQVAKLRTEVTQAIDEMEDGQASPINTDSSKPLTKSEALASIIEYINGNQYVKAVQLLRSFRAVWPSDVFGQTSEDDVLAILNIYCASQAEKRTGLFVLFGLESDLGQVHNQLMVLNIQMTGRCSSAPPTTPTSRERITKSPDSSSL
ncbi:hypothetical protein FSP39_019611 [Pinctada imbricata]|uniref:Uncharacterized protein n=1 Tax=Pinctada imbricata TaxID=66713 RepID=A0AA89C486_PINIB|nr:hypothetical protein FSP39_019611 [Pinctada imbricata]